MCTVCVFVCVRACVRACVCENILKILHNMCIKTLRSVEKKRMQMYVVCLMQLIQLRLTLTIVKCAI